MFLWINGAIIFCYGRGLTVHRGCLLAPQRVLPSLGVGDPTIPFGENPVRLAIEVVHLLPGRELLGGSLDRFRSRYRQGGISLFKDDHFGLCCHLDRGEDCQLLENG
ncbi:UNVERIFIED_CONTAM: hypothetical protein Sradi_6874000 [Sesamum radiatum]|uniref:Uncharacterized protein n=1 Tax=Sesamum radiatum TaxID=300843 RepID=A0AAW2JM03_SESRA